MTQPGIPLGHTIPAHRAFGWCSHCPDHTVAEELAAWQTREPIDVSPGPAAEIDRLRTENERMRHELEVMYGGAFDKLPPAAVSAAVAPPTDRAAVLTESERKMLAYALDQAQEHIWSRDGFTDEDQAAVDSLRRLTPDEPAAGARQDGGQS
jgi:hypothetical protein